MISQVFYAFGQSSFGLFVIQFKAYITSNKIHLNVALVPLLKIFCDGKCAICTVHPVYFPFYLFHDAKLFIAIVTQLLMKENIFATWR